MTAISLNSNPALVITHVAVPGKLETKSLRKLCHSRENKSRQHEVNLNANSFLNLSEEVVVMKVNKTFKDHPKIWTETKITYCLRILPIHRAVRKPQSNKSVLCVIDQTGESISSISDFDRCSFISLIVS